MKPHDSGFGIGVHEHRYNSDFQRIDERSADAPLRAEHSKSSLVCLTSYRKPTVFTPRSITLIYCCLDITSKALLFKKGARRLA